MQGAMLWWMKPALPVRASVIVGTDVAAAVRHDGMDYGARHHVVVAKADATRDG